MFPKLQLGQSLIRNSMPVIFQSMIRYFRHTSSTCQTARQENRLGCTKKCNMIKSLWSQPQFEAWLCWNQVHYEKQIWRIEQNNLGGHLSASSHWRASPSYFSPTSKICEEIIKTPVWITSENKQTPDNSAEYSSTVSFPVKGMTMAIKTKLADPSSLSYSVRPQLQLSNPKEPLLHPSHAIRAWVKPCQRTAVF